MFIRHRLEGNGVLSPVGFGAPEMSGKIASMCGVAMDEVDPWVCFGLASSSANVNVLKRLYGSKVSETTYKRDRLLELCKKDTNFRGEGKYIVVGIAGTAGGSADFASALASQEATVESRFFVTRRKEYQVYSVDNEAIEASRGNNAALIEILKRQVGAAKRKFDESLAKKTHGVGPIGRIQASSATNTTTLTLRDRTDIVGTWEKNTLIQFATDDGSGVSPSGLRAGVAKVTALDRDSGTVTLNAVVNTITTNTDDFIHRYGDYGNAMLGLQAWEPISDPSSTAFWSVDRTVDLSKLAGIRWFGGGKLKEETLQDAGAECQINGINPSHCFVNPLDFKELGKELGGAKVQEGGEGVTGFSSIKVHTAVGTVTVVSTPYVKKSYFWMGDPENLTFGTAGECPMDLAQGYSGGLLLPTADAKQGRIGCYGNFYVDNPGEWLIGAWSAAS